MSTGDALAFSVRFSWSGIKPCGKISPAFTIQNAPKETESLRFVLKDKDAPNFQHGGAAVPYDGGGVIPEGEIDYIGPCPPPGSIHHYVWTIEALDNAGRVIAWETAEGRFPER
jgi:phosphatidylethanolamine-binding protein (PEBP) family uncharacterized protein